MKFKTSNSPHIDAAKHLADVLETSLNENKHTLLLLAGGSAEDVYNEVPRMIDEDLDFSGLMVVMGDERWDRNPEHKDSDWVHFTSTSFYHFLREKGAILVDILSGDDHDTEAAKFAELLEQALENEYFVISMLGIGTDGHTAGILPADAESFADAFFVDQLAVPHELDTVHPKRITITPAMIKQADEVFCYARGSKKKQTLQTVAELNSKHPDQEWEDSIPKYPVLILSETDATVFTDQEVA